MREPDGLVEVLEDEGVAEKRLFLLESEFARLLSVAERRDNTTSAVLQASYGTRVTRGRWRRTRRTGDGRARDAGRSHHAWRAESQAGRRRSHQRLRQPVPVRLLARSKLLPDGDSVPDDVVRGLGEMVAGVFPVAKCVTRVELNPDAKGLWREQYEQLSSPPVGMLGDVLARAARTSNGSP